MNETVNLTIFTKQSGRFYGWSFVLHKWCKDIKLIHYKWKTTIVRLKQSNGRGWNDASSILGPSGGARAQLQQAPPFGPTMPLGDPYYFCSGVLTWLDFVSELRPKSLEIKVSRAWSIGDRLTYNLFLEKGLFCYYYFFFEGIFLWRLTKHQLHFPISKLKLFQIPFHIYIYIYIYFPNSTPIKPNKSIQFGNDIHCIAQTNRKGMHENCYAVYDLAKRWWHGD